MLKHPKEKDFLSWTYTHLHRDRYRQSSLHKLSCKQNLLATVIEVALWRSIQFA